MCCSYAQATRPGPTSPFSEPARLRRVELGVVSLTSSTDANEPYANATTRANLCLGEAKGRRNPTQCLQTGLREQLVIYRARLRRAHASASLQQLGRTPRLPHSAMIL